MELKFHKYCFGLPYIYRKRCWSGRLETIRTNVFNHMWVVGICRLKQSRSEGARKEIPATYFANKISFLQWGTVAQRRKFNRK